MQSGTYRVMDIKVKVWLADNQGEGLLGDGRYRLLAEISRQHSLQKAADKLDISYRKAWGDIRTVEDRLGFALIESYRGGAGGGTSILTKRAEKILKAFGRARDEIQVVAQRQYKQKLKKLLKI